jgi:hypothetical protein
MDPIDLRAEALHQIVLWSAEFGDTIISETDTRFKVIDRVLTDGLGWQRESVTTEEHTGGGRLDYRLQVDGSTRLIVEAKRDAISFGLTHRQTGQAYKLDGPAFTSEAKEAIGQVIGYCAFKGAELACVTNGREWIILRANRLGDGKDVLSGKGFVFASLADIEANFAQFHDLISADSAKSLRYRGIFQEVEGVPLRDFSFHKSLRAPDSKHLLTRSNFAVDFDELMNSFFQRLTGEEDEEMVTECFVVTKESELADVKISRIAEDLVQRMREINTQTGIQLLELIRSVQQQNRHRFVLLVGNKGAGKSTFVDRFFRFVLPDLVAEKLVTIRLNLALSEGSSESILPWLNKQLLEICEREVFEAGPDWDETIGAMFFDEYQRWSRGSMKHLYESDKTQFKIEFGRHVEQLRRDQPHDFIKRLLKHIIRSRKRVPCLVFDNTDHHSIHFQEIVFQYARSIYESELCLVIIPITDKTSWQLSRQGALQSFESEVLFLPVPQPHRVIERRITYLLKKLDQKDRYRAQDYFLGRNIRLDIKNIAAFAASLNRIFVESRSTSDWLGGLVNYDIRRLLELTRDVIASPHLPLEDLLKAHIAGSSVSVPEWKIKHAIIKRRYDLYPEGEHPFVQNIFNLTGDTPTTPLLGLRILQFLRDARPDDDGSENNFVPVSALYEHVSALGVEQRVTTSWLQTLLRTGLVLDYDPTVTSVSAATRIELSPAGKVHLIWGSADEEYIKAMKDITPIRDRTVFDQVHYYMRNPSANWSRALATFIDYLACEDSFWCRIPDHRVFDGQRAIGRRLRQVADGVTRFHR